MSLPQPAYSSRTASSGARAGFPPAPRRAGADNIGAVQRAAQVALKCGAGGLSDVLSRVTATTADWRLVRLGAGGAARLPRSDLATIYMVADGAVTLTASRAGHETLRRGDVAILLHGECHRIHAVGSEAIDRLVTLEHDSANDSPTPVQVGPGKALAEVLVGQLSLEWPSQLTPRAALPGVLIMRGSDRSAVGSLDVLLSHISAAVVGAGGSAYLSKLAEIMIIKALRLYGIGGGDLLLGPTDRPFEPVTRMIDENLARPWTVAELAQSVGMSRSAFAASFSRGVGQSPIDYVTEQRLQRAARLLADPGQAIAEISNKVGYQSVAAFTRRFKQRFGQAPGAYQRARLSTAGAL